MQCHAKKRLLIFSKTLVCESKIASLIKSCECLFCELGALIEKTLNFLGPKRKKVESFKKNSVYGKISFLL